MIAHQLGTRPAKATVLVRYGAIPEVARFKVATTEPLPRGAAVVVQSPRGLEVGTLLEPVDTPSGASTDVADQDLKIVRRATSEDQATLAELRRECEGAFDVWNGRIREWKLNLQLIDMEWMLDRSKLVLYVLNNRGPDCTKLALQAAAAGLGIIEVQPVGADGLMQPETGGGCGSGGCGHCG
jgi:cell fate regulator YaaT (PSP1 superfamily)